ncbi:MAG: ATP-dependent zinc metalloprotease FtsH [Acidimicrobiia bacterium]
MLKKSIRRPRRWAVLLWLPILVLLGSNLLGGGGTDRAELSLDRVEALIAEGVVVEAVVESDADVIRGVLEPGILPGDGTEFTATYADGFEGELTERLIDAGVTTTIERSGTSALSIVFGLLPLLILVGLGFLVFRGLKSGGGIMSIGKSKPRQVTADQPKVSFAEVAGLDEAVEELQEIKHFLADPDSFRAMGARMPKGVLLAGPPGTGKTLLARAVAGEAGVPFLSISGSDFVEMFVGVGASRVRSLFAQAKALAPVIIFIDEIDAVGRHRGTGVGGGNDEREQTLNQLLVELDGFESSEGVIVMAATNRPDVLDPALLRPGRFDRQILVDRPDLRGRIQILEVHAKGRPLAEDVDLAVLARRTPGFTGADLANVLNEAVLLATRRQISAVGNTELEDAVDKVISGPQRRSRVLSEDELKVVAYHEAGHALVGWTLPCADPIHKVTIIPRGRALGYTQALPTEDRYLVHRSELYNQLAMLAGGRAAEELVYGDPTTGASNDLEKATQISRQMVVRHGMSEGLGFVQFEQGDEPFLGRDLARAKEYADNTAAEIDNEVRRVLGQALEDAHRILVANRPALDRMAEALIEQETLDADAIAELFAGVPKWRRGRSLQRVGPPGTVDLEDLAV